MAKCRITIEEVPEKGKIVKNKSIVFEIEHWSFQDERGITSAGKEFESNEQRRLTIKGWSGCLSYEEYNTETTVKVDEMF